MSLGGDGVPGIERGREMIVRLANDRDFVPRRFRSGGRYAVSNNSPESPVPFDSCVLCGAIIWPDEASNLEHVFPQWVHRLAGDVGEVSSKAFMALQNPPTWRQLELASHSNCNTLFARYVENRARSAVKAMVEGGVVTKDQIDAVLDWLDKVRVSASHMATAFLGHDLELKYQDRHFANSRVGLADRVAFFFRVEGHDSPLDLWNCLDHGFRSTPGALAIRINDLVIVSVSNDYLLSPAFGMSECKFIDGNLVQTEATNTWMRGFGIRRSRLGRALTIAQPMRRQHFKLGALEVSKALHESGDGNIYNLAENEWRRTRSVDFSTLAAFPFRLGYALASLETIEWLIIQKELDFERNGRPKRWFAGESIEGLWLAKNAFLDEIAQHMHGIRLEYSDRT